MRTKMMLIKITVLNLFCICGLLLFFYAFVLVFLPNLLTVSFSANGTGYPFYALLGIDSLFSEYGLFGRLFIFVTSLMVVCLVTSRLFFTSYEYLWKRLTRISQHG